MVLLVDENLISLNVITTNLHNSGIVYLEEASWELDV